MATADEYAAWIVQNADKKGTPEFQTVAKAYLASRPPAAAQMPAMDPSDGTGTLSIGPIDTGIQTPQWLNRGLAGVGKAFSDVGTGVSQFLPGGATRDDVAQARKRDAPLMATGAGMTGNVLGNAAIFAPTAMLPGANTIAGGALVGGLAGLIQPSTSNSETLLNTGIGGAAGALVPLASRVWQAGKAAAEPFYQAGQDTIVGRALNRAAGSDAPTVAQRLQDAAAPFVGPNQGAVRATMGELVPGSVPTVGQAAENPGIAALERAATATTPDVTNQVSQRIAAQNAARTGVLTDMAGTGGARDFAAANRDATAEQLYGAARRLGIDPAKLTPDALQNIATFSRRIPDAVLNQARELAKIKGEPMTDATSLSGMHWVKQALDGMIAAEQGPGGNTTKLEALTGLKNDLVQGMGQLSPAYDAARQTFAAMSRPVNQMDVAQAIADKSINKLTGNLQPNAYANALTDQTAARATGFRPATLESVMDNSQLNQLNMLLKDVQRSNASQNVGRGAGSDTVQKLAYTNLLDQSGVPTFLREFAPTQIAGNLLSRGADAAYGRANRELSARLAEVMLDPGQAASLMQKATPAQKNALLGMIQRGASGLALSAPAAANAQK